MNRRRLTSVELLVILAALVVLAFILFAAFSRAPHAAKRSQCVNNLKQIGLGTRIFASTHWDLFPGSYYSNQVAAPTFDADDHFAFLINELSPPILHCPADAAREPAKSMVYLDRTNISYFVNLSAAQTRPQEFLGGDRNLTIKGIQPSHGKVTIFPGDKLGWTSDLHNNQGNILMGDGSVQQLTLERLLTRSINVLLFP